MLGRMKANESFPAGQSLNKGGDAGNFRLRLIEGKKNNRKRSSEGKGGRKP